VIGVDIKNESVEYLTLFFNSLYELSNSMAPYILFGLLFAGVLHELVPDTIVSKHLGKSSILSVIKATVFGIPLPVCSCGVVPLASSIKKCGASNGSTLSFLISTPITGVDSILATYGIFGWVFTIYRVVTSMIISIVAGVLTNFYGDKQEEKPKFVSTPKDDDISCCASSCGCDNEIKKSFSVQRSLKYSFKTLLADIAWPLFLGLILGALITILVPTNLSETLLEYSWLSYVIVIAISVPMYVCATASLPIAAGLMLAGVSPGAAFVFLSAGPATNTVTIGVVKKMLGSRTLYIYLGTIILGSTLFGFGLDYIFRDISVREIIHIHEDIGVFEWASSIVLWALILYHILIPYFKSKK
jgi:uncharacterized membrane protein YraQ (UPF0718 family)